MAVKHCPHCGSDLGEPGKGRSVPQHRRFFALCRAAFDQWPEKAERQFTSAEELRKYFQMRAGYREIGAQIPLTGISRERAMLLAEASIRAAGAYAVPVIHGDTLVIFRPKSIAFDKLGHKDACALFDDVAAFIATEIGVPADQLLKEAETAA